jgi:hypothetical protein
LNARGVTDRTIVVDHLTPSRLRDFWCQWEGRGVAVPFIRYHVHHLVLPVVMLERLAASLWSLLLVLLVAPVLVRAVALTRRSDRRSADLPAFFALHVVLLVAHRVGEWKGMLRLIRRLLARAR